MNNPNKVAPKGADPEQRPVSPTGSLPAQLTYRLENHSFPPGITLAEALGTIGLVPEQVLAICSGVLIHADHILQSGDQIQLISVISGG